MEVPLIPMQSTLERSAAPDAPFLPSGKLLGHLSFMSHDPLSAFVRARDEKGDIVRVRMVHKTALFIYRPEYIKHVLLDNAANYTKTTRGYDKLRLILGNGLVTSEGDFWLRQRRTAQPAFHRQRIAGFADTMVTATDDLVHRWRPMAKTGVEVDVAAAMYRLTLRIAGETLLSTDVTGEARGVGDAIDVVLRNFSRLVSSALPWPEYWPSAKNWRFWRAVRSIQRVVGAMIADRRESGADIADLLGMFMAARDPETGEGMSDAQLLDEVLTMFLAGHETTANGLSWTLYLLAQHPEVAAQIEAELHDVLGNRAATMADVSGLGYTTQVLRESMRLYPPVWALAREAAAEDTIGGYRVPKGAFVFISQHAIHRHPGLWSNPETFDPDRFGLDRPAPDRFAYLPFSRGQRQCIGDRFAEMELVLVIATLLQRYRFRLVPGHRVTMEPAVTLRPRDGIKMFLEAR
jgi:cytochrome P450